MMSGFKTFVSNAWDKVTGFFQKIGSWFRGILSGTKAQMEGGGVQWTFPNYEALAEQLLSAADSSPVAEATLKGQKIAGQIRDYGLVSRNLSPNQASEIEGNVATVASALGLAFETGVVLYLIEQKGLQLTGNWTVQVLKDRHNVFVGRVRDRWGLSTRSTKARDKFIELLLHNVGMMAETIYDKSLGIMKCKELEAVEYIGLDQASSGRSPTIAAGTNIGGADLIVTCKESGEMSYWSTKYVSNPHNSIAKKTPADVHRILGGKGNRSDAYYYRLTATADPEARADLVLYDLWNSLVTGHAAVKVVGRTKAILDGEWVASMFQSLVRGDVGTNPAWMNYAAGRSAVGDYATAFRRDLRMGKDTRLHARSGATAEAILEGGNKVVSTAEGAKRPRPSIKIKLITPGQMGMRRTYLKIYVNDAPPDGDRYSKYTVQVQMNNLTTD